MPTSGTQTKPSFPVIKQLYADSRNRCAFPNCDAKLIDGETVIGEVCHIRASRPLGPRYDPNQTQAERHGYSNLILLCGVHHKIVDDDPESYTVESLTKLKEQHAERFSALLDEEAESGTKLLMEHSAVSIGQSGGITAHTIHQVINNHPPSGPAEHSLRRQSEARRLLAPELQRTIDRVLYIHGRAVANFVSHSADSKVKPTDRKQDFIPYWPKLYPNAPQVRDLGEDDAAALIGYYDSLHSLNDDVNDWWDREGQLPVNLFNSFLHGASKCLRLALICIERFELEALIPPPYESWGTTSSRINQALKSEAHARNAHLARFEAKAKK
jgi:hypothetical protein